MRRAAPQSSPGIGADRGKLCASRRALRRLSGKPQDAALVFDIPVVLPGVYEPSHGTYAAPGAGAGTGSLPPALPAHAFGCKPPTC